MVIDISRLRMQSFVGDFIYTVKLPTKKACIKYQTTYETECFSCGIPCSRKAKNWHS